MEISQATTLLFTLEFPPYKGGIAKYYENLANYWPTGDLFVLADNIWGGTDSEKIKFRPLRNKYLRPRWLPALWYLSQELKYARAGQVIVGQILPLGKAAYFLSKFIKFKYSVVLHGLDFSLAVKTKAKRKITGKILSRADKIICANNYTANLVKSFALNLSDKITVVNPGIEPSFVRNPQRVRELKEKNNLNDKIILFGLGHLVARKGFDQVIKAVAAINSSLPRISYAIGGSGPEKENLIKLTDSLSPEIKNKIIFLGQLSDADRWAWLELCDIFIMTSRNLNGDFEGFGTVYLEANLAGKPIIAGDSGGVRDAVINNINGILVDSENLPEISQAIIKLAADPALRQALGEQGKRRTVENFNAKKQVEKLYHQLIS